MEFEAWKDTNSATDPNVKDPDPEKLPKPIGWRILVRPLPPMKKTPGGIELPDEVVDKQTKVQTVGRLLAVGPLAWTRPDMGDEPWAQVGDYVLFGKWTGQQLECEGVVLRVLNDDEITCVVPDPYAVRR